MAIANIMNDDTTLLSSKMMELAMERQKVIANNMANSDTPNFIRKELSFKEKLAEIVRGGDLSDLESLSGKIEEDRANAPRLDGNNVAAASEMNHMMQNGVLFNMLARAYNARMSIIKEAIKTP